MNESNKVSGYKVKTQKLYVFLDTRKGQPKVEINKQFHLQSQEKE